MNVQSAEATALFSERVDAGDDGSNDAGGAGAGGGGVMKLL